MSNETNPGKSCFDKARAKGEPTFTLRAQDVTADLVVDFWTLVQLRVRAQVEVSGKTLSEALDEVRTHFGIPPYAPGVLESAKLDQASMIAEAMRHWPNRRQAD